MRKVLIGAGFIFLLAVLGLTVAEIRSQEAEIQSLHERSRVAARDEQTYKARIEALQGSLDFQNKKTMNLESLSDSRGHEIAKLREKLNSINGLLKGYAPTNQRLGNGVFLNEIDGTLCATAGLFLRSHTLSKVPVPPELRDHVRELIMDREDAKSTVYAIKTHLPPEIVEEPSAKPQKVSADGDYNDF